MRPARSGFASRMKRRGVTPLVTFVNLPGKNSSKSGSTFSRSSCEWSSATPLTFAPATVARYAMRTERYGCSAMIDIARMRSLVIAEALAHGEEELVVDPVDDLEVTRKQPPEQIDRPDLERFGKESVARVCEALLRDLPCGIPLEATFVDQDAHQLGHGDDGMRVVELEDDTVGELGEVESLREHAVEEVADRGGDEEVLLLQAQLFALRGGVLWVQHLRDVLGERLRSDCLFVVAGIEDAQVERIRGDRAPQAERVDAAVVIPRHHVVVGHRLHVPRRNPAAAGRHRPHLRSARCGRRTRSAGPPRGAGTPRAIRGRARHPAAPPAVRRRTSDGRSRTRTGCRTRCSGRSSSQASR